MEPSLQSTTGPTVHSPSEASYSSGPSRTSTRSTSPDTSSQRSSPLLDLHHLITTSSIVPETNHAVVDQQSPSKMDKPTPALPADGLNNLRRASGKFNMERNVGPANYQQPSGVRPGAPMGPGNLASRSLTSNNWRAQAMTDGMYTNFDAANPQNQQQQQQHFGRPTLAHRHHQQLPPGAASVYPPHDSMAFPDSLLDTCYAYCYDRGNGQYTRLIPADMIPNLCDVAALQQDCLGMIVLPVPRALPANGRSSNVEPVMLKINADAVTKQTPPLTPTSPADNIQHCGLHWLNTSHYLMTKDLSGLYKLTSQRQAHIDTIVGAGPRTPTHSHGGNNSTSIASSTSTGPAIMAPTSNLDQQQALPLRPLANNQGPRLPMGGAGGGGGGTLGDLSSSMHAPANQHHGGHGHGHSQGHGYQAGGGIGHGHGHHQHQSQQQQFPQRRPKIYCDKWVHEGVCAFTQQGCKYKHEMPFDKMTQHQLGLFHGLPAWWKKHQAELARQRDPSDNEQDGGGAVEGSRSSSGGLIGRSACGGGAGAAVGGNLAWRRAHLDSIKDTAHGFVDHSAGTTSGRGGMGSNPADHGQILAHHHQRGNPMAPQSPLGTLLKPPSPPLFVLCLMETFADREATTAWSKSPFGPIAPPGPTPTDHAIHHPVRGVISTSNPYASLSNVDEGLTEENKAD
ncbi:hypothetical protein PG991_007227 [Apiospora marii]|uniref:C3H1-type domain-containing protein n=1 Tax=Apiospora marii TaxID=335849 RepID=A0ABR1RT93_9PEZI